MPNQISLAQVVQSVQQCCTDNKMSLDAACCHIAQSTPGVTPELLSEAFIQLKSDAGPVDLIKVLASGGYPMIEIVEPTYSKFPELTLTDLCSDLSEGFKSAGKSFTPEDMENSLGKLITDHPGHSFSSSLPAIQGQGGSAPVFLPLYDPSFGDAELAAVQTVSHGHVILANTGGFLHIYEVTPTGGNLTKIIAANGAFYHGITADASAFYVTDTADHLSAYSYGGDLLWQLNSPGEPKMAVNDHALYRYAKGGLSAIDKRNGQILWTQAQVSFSRTAFDIAADNDTVIYKGFQVNPDRSMRLLVQALDGQTGNVAWTWVKTDGDPTESPVQLGLARGLSIHRHAAIVGYGDIVYYLGMSDGKQFSVTYVDINYNLVFNVVTVGDRLIIGTQGIAAYIISNVFNESGYFPGMQAVKNPVDTNTNGPTYPTVLSGQRVAMVYLKGNTTEVDVADLSAYLDNLDLAGKQKYVVTGSLSSPVAQTFTTGDVVYGIAVQSKESSLCFIVALPM